MVDASLLGAVVLNNSTEAHVFDIDTGPFGIETTENGTITNVSK